MVPQPVHTKVQALVCMLSLTRPLIFPGPGACSLPLRDTEPPGAWLDVQKSVHMPPVSLLLINHLRDLTILMPKHKPAPLSTTF